MRDDLPLQPPVRDGEDGEDGDGVDLLDLLLPLAQHLKLLILGPLAFGLAAFGISFSITPEFTARTVFLPPQQQQSAAAAALSQLGALASLTGGGSGGAKSPAEQYVALVQSTTIADRLVDRFKLMDVYKSEYRFQARTALAGNVHVTLGKKDGLITVEVDDKIPQRAADLANAYVEELRQLTGQLALTEAQQRRVFFEAEMKQTRDTLTRAQETLEASGFNQGALKAEPKAAAEGYAKLKAEVTAAEVRLQTMRRNLSDNTPEVQQQQTLVSALRGQLASLERSGDLGGGSEYVSKYREFKYQETLFELFARQYEMARVDESREGALVQVVDIATPPEWKSKPKRALIGIVATLLGLLSCVAFVIARHLWRRSASEPGTAMKLSKLRAALKRR
ncbi:Wzz/FepE/Etk N-terminal domain-containing protein [Methylibium sp.]|uniref:Wzz/FepE/Etk N-terminal domain-containing protein n=1 Tax=Methylibium sp. TaxID=2067992 RepID=UPI003D0B9A42